jgi:hypothetical protein
MDAYQLPPNRVFSCFFHLFELLSYIYTLKYIL